MRAVVDHVARFAAVMLIAAVLLTLGLLMAVPVVLTWMTLGAAWGLLAAFLLAMLVLTLILA